MLSNFTRNYSQCINTTATIITNNLFQYDTRTKLKESHNVCVNLALSIEDGIRQCEKEPSWEKQKECLKKEFIIS
jgi:hypothetical protein